MNDQIKVIGYNGSQEMAGGLVESLEQFGNEMGNRASSLKDVQADIISSVVNMAQAVESKLNENEETISRNNSRPQCTTNYIK